MANDKEPKVKSWRDQLRDIIEEIKKEKPKS